MRHVYPVVMIWLLLTATARAVITSDGIGTHQTTPGEPSFGVNTDGVAALAELKRHHPNLPILMVSASTTQEIARKSEALGAQGFLLKPFEPADLMGRVERILGEPAERQ